MKATIKRALASLMTVITITACAAVSVYADTGSAVKATLNDMKVSFNGGETKTIQSYMISDYNYVRVREVVAPLNYAIGACGGGEVGVMIDSEYPYVDVGAMETLTVKNPAVTIQTGNVYFNGTPYAASCFLYADRYYFKLADIQAAADSALASATDAAKRSATVKSVTKPLVTSFKGFEASWNAATNIVHINTPETDLMAVFNAERYGTAVPTPQPSQTPAPVSTSAVTSQPALTNPPTVGSTLANILIDPVKGAYQSDGKTPLYSNFTTPYANIAGIGQCTWYVYARLWETTGVDTRALFVAKTSKGIEDVANGNYTGFTATTDKTKVAARSIAVWPTHMIFIEYVERDSNGNPLNIYYTEVNNHDTAHMNGIFYPGYDAVVKVIPYTDWINKTVSGNQMLGYIMAD